MAIKSSFELVDEKLVDPQPFGSLLMVMLKRACAIWN